MAKTRQPAAPPLTPAPARLRKALVEAARDTQRLAGAFGVKVPVAPRTKSEARRGSR